MTEPSANAVPETVPPPATLEPDAIGVTQDTIIGMATSGPAAVVGISLASLAGTAAYGGGVIMLIAAVPMLVIANSYRRLNRWNAHSGASFEWVGRAINPYLGFLTGWLMIAGFVVGTLSGAEVLGPSVLAIFGASAANTWANVGIATGVTLLMMLIAVLGIRITARTQVVMAAVEYAILVGMSIWGLCYVLGHHAHTYPVTSGWFSLTGVGGKGDVVGGFLIAVFAYSGWDGTVYVNEEVRQRRVNPGRAAIIAVALLAVIYTLAQAGLQGVVPPSALQANYANALVYAAQGLGGTGWAKVMALSLALSVIATTGAGIVMGSRIIYGMAGHRTLPRFLASVARRFATPAAATIVFGGVVIALAWVYLLVTSVEDAFNYVVSLTGLLFALFYILTALAGIAYYRRRIARNVQDAITVGILPLAAAAFLAWMVVKSMLEAQAPQNWSMLGILVVGVALMLISRLVLKSPFYSIRLESAPPAETAQGTVGV